MVKPVVGDILKSTAQTLVNTVNCVGIMGKGIALEFKNHFPDMYEDYVRRCKENEVKLGRPYLFRRPSSPWILNFPTKEHWRSVSRLEDISQGLEYLEQHYKEWGITSLAVPPLGCGQGQLEWRVVGPTLYRHLKRLDIPVEIYAPYGTPHEQLRLDFFERTREDTTKRSASGALPRMEPSWVGLVDILARIEQEPYHWAVGRTMFQKIAYFATESGIPTKLQYRQGSFGPYASELKGLITRLVNNGLIREEHLGRMFAVKVGPTFEDARKTYKHELNEWSTILERVTDLFVRMRTDQAEVAATVHFTARSLKTKTPKKPSESDVLVEVMRWKQKRRPPLREADVAIAIRNLSMLGWLDVMASADLPISEEVILEA